MLWDKAVLRLRRSSDNDQKYVFFDGNGKISLSSATGSISSLPSATTLGTWVGVNDAHISLWIGITNNNIVNVNKTAGQGSVSLQPQFISSGGIITKNGEPTVDFLTGGKYLTANQNTDLDSGSNYTVLSVVNSIDSNTNGAFLGTVNVHVPNPNSWVAMYCDRTSAKLMFDYINQDVTVYRNLKINQTNTSNQQLLTNILNNKNMYSYYNGVFQNSLLATGTYRNESLQIGDRWIGSGGTGLRGTIQEIIIFPSNKTLDLTELNTDINDYYNIY